MKPNILLGILNPRELPQFRNCIKDIDNVDRFHVKFFTPEHDAYYTLRLWFLHHPEYSHLTLVPDDVLFTKENIQTLIQDIEDYDFPVLTGYSNINLTDKLDTYTISFQPEHIERPKRQYRQLRKYDLFNEGDTYRFGRFLNVGWLGFSLTTIRRDIVEQIEFEDDSKYNGLPYGHGCCVDTSFSYQCLKRRIPMVCDLDVKILHLRQGASSLMEYFYAGIRPRELHLVKRK